MLHPKLVVFFYIYTLVYKVLCMICCKHWATEHTGNVLKACMSKCSRSEGSNSINSSTSIGAMIAIFF